MKLHHPSLPMKMENTVQTYAWGSHTMIAELIGLPSPSSVPQAEIWMGAHPKAPSKVHCQNHWAPLDDVIHANAVAILGKETAARYDNTMPFLMKVLAAGQPLSVQAHPDKEQAQRGYAREEAAGIDMAADHRNYRDPNHKPECLCALTPFCGLCGFRPIQEILEITDAVWPTRFQTILSLLVDEGIKPFFKAMFQLPQLEREALVGMCLEQAGQSALVHPAYEWMARLNQTFPMDIGVLAPLYLNIVELKPGEAIYLPARQMHAYLTGMGIEVMANSDNVLRGGLTPKHIDVPELLRILDFDPQTPQLLEPEAKDDGVGGFPKMADEFVLSVLTVNRQAECRFESNSVAIILCTEGTALLNSGGQSDPMTVQKGESILIPASAGVIALTGRATLYCATV